MTKAILLTGSAGKLGSAIKNSSRFSSLLTPSSSELDITKPETVSDYFSESDFDAIIHCAALARMGKCEENPELAQDINCNGTKNLVEATIKKEATQNKKIRFVHISTDGVYGGIVGDYSEDAETKPYNVYGKTKLEAEKHVQRLENHCIIRTSFFDPNNISFEDSATDAYSSKMTISDLISAIHFLLNSDFTGIINVGDEKKSDFDRYKEYKPDLKETTFATIQESVPFPLAKDASMNISQWKRMVANSQ